jgi:PDZ domain-containing protein
VPRLALPSVERIPGGRAFASLSRRVRTLVIASVLFIVLFALALTMPVPYVILSPGPTFNTIGIEQGSQVIVIQGRKPNQTSGHLNMTTVSISGGSVTPVQALVAWLKGDEVVVPKSAVYPPGQSEQQTNQQNTEEFQQSQDSATAAALCELGYPKGFGIIDVSSDGPSHGILEPGDRFISVSGTPVASRDQLDAALSAHQPGDKVTVVVNRRGETARLTVTLGKAPDTGKAYLGVVPDNTCLAPFTVTIHLADIGGPSAGMMFALGIIDKVGYVDKGPVDLTGGRFIAGTGTINASGKVGAIGGIQLKMLAARRKGASVFLAPASNCSDVRGATPSGLQVVKVSTLHEAVQDLLRIQHDQPVPSC